MRPSSRCRSANSWVTDESKVLVAALDDPTALAAKAAIERAGRIGDCVIVSQGLDKSIHGSTNDKKEIDPNNRGNIILGSVAYYIDRYGYEVFPLAMKMLRGEEAPANDHAAHLDLRQERLHRISAVQT